jgi:tRNA (mo5U34)-methyltransferase
MQDLAKRLGAMSREDLATSINTLKWFHQIDFGEGLISPGIAPIDVLRKQAAVYFQHGLAGKSVLDIGCWDGFYSFEAKKYGASRVLATDHFAWSDECWGKRRCIELARAHIAPDVEIMDIDIPDLSIERVGAFDTVLLLGVFYHLKNPFATLEQIAPLASECLIVETHLDAMDYSRPAMVFYPGNELGGDYTNWWGPNRACVEAMLLGVGFSRVRFTLNPVSASRGIFHAYRGITSPH